MENLINDDLEQSSSDKFNLKLYFNNNNHALLGFYLC